MDICHSIHILVRQPDVRAISKVLRDTLHRNLGGEQIRVGSPNNLGPLRHKPNWYESMHANKCVDVKDA